MGKDNYKMRREAFKFWDLVRFTHFTVIHMSDGYLLDADDGGHQQTCPSTKSHIDAEA